MSRASAQTAVPPCRSRECPASSPAQRTTRSRHGSSGTSWSPGRPSGIRRTVVFLGDFIDHGPEPLEGTEPLFVGHYWQRGEPRVLTNKVACVDYSAGEGEPLVAYRWDGEGTLSDAKFVSSR